MRVNPTYAPPFRPLFDAEDPNYNKMFLVWRGGRGSAKSTAVGEGLVYRGMVSPQKILCTREYQNSMADSVQALIKERCTALGPDAEEFYTHTETETTGQNDTLLAYKGLAKNINSLKSLQGFNKLWIEEAQTTSANSIKIIFPTIRAAGSQIIITYNPDQDSDPIHEFVNSLPPELVYLCDVNWNDNPWFLDNQSLMIQRNLALTRIAKARTDEQREVEQEEYDWVWEGKTRKKARARIFAGKCFQEDFRVEFRQHYPGSPDGYYINGKPAQGPYYGLDFGYANDPAAGCRAWICDDCVYIDHEFYEHGVELDDLADCVRTLPMADRHTVKADNSRPESISHLRTPRASKACGGKIMPGLNTVAAEKWPDSVDDGITVLKSFRAIIMHSRCVNFWEEQRLYSFKVDAKTGDVLAEVVDKFNHLWDALRYALAPFIKRSGKGLGHLEYYTKLLAKEATNHA